MPLLLVNAKEVGDEVHTIGEVSPILCAALLQAIRSHVYARQHFSQPRIVDLLEHLWEMFPSNLVPGEAPRCWTDRGRTPARLRHSRLAIRKQGPGPLQDTNCIEKFEPKVFPRVSASSVSDSRAPLFVLDWRNRFALSCAQLTLARSLDLRSKMWRAAAENWRAWNACRTALFETRKVFWVAMVLALSWINGVPLTAAHAQGDDIADSASRAGHDRGKN